MTAIIGLLELEQERCLASGQPVSEALQVAHRSARELIALMGDSLTWPRSKPATCNWRHRPLS